MASTGAPGHTTVIYAQVGLAKANHRVDLQSNLLRPKSYSLPSKIVYLGDVATNLLAHLEHPGTPLFSIPPNFNEQKWMFQTESGGMNVQISSESYWGFGLLNSGYINKIELTGLRQSQARLLFDLSASLGHRPWEFKHPVSASRHLSKRGHGLSSESNELVWKEFISMARAQFQESFFIMEQRKVEVERRIMAAEEHGGWRRLEAKQLLDEALYDLDVAKGALADDNAPGMERALARAEAALIQADPGNKDRDDDLKKAVKRERILSVETGEEEISFVDLTPEEE